MKRITPLVALSIALCMSVAVGCSSTTGAAVDDAEPDEQSADTDQPHTDAVISDVNNVFYGMFSALGRLGHIQCDCAPRQMGYDSSNQCHAEVSTPFEEAASPVSHCISVSAMDVADSPPEGATELLACIADSLVDLNSCIDGVIGEATPTCDESILDELDQCERAMDRQFDACDALQDGPTEAWFDALGEQSEVNDCFSNLPF